MNQNDAAIELAEARVLQERDASVARIQAELAGTSGRFICDCGSEISEARRRAVPHTEKCIDCATFLERSQRRRA